MNKKKLKVNSLKYKNITKKLFCYRPFKFLFIDDINFYPFCLCAHTDNKIVDKRNDKFRKSNNKSNSIIERWNSKYMQNFRKQMLLHNQVEVCTSRCLRSKNINNI